MKASALADSFPAEKMAVLAGGYVDGLNSEDVDVSHRYGCGVSNPSNPSKPNSAFHAKGSTLRRSMRLRHD